MSSLKHTTLMTMQTLVQQFETLVQNLDKYELDSQELNKQLEINCKMRADLLLHAATIEALKATIEALKKQSFNAKANAKSFEVGDEVEAVWYNDDGSTIWCNAKIVAVDTTVVEMFQKGVIEHEESGLDVDIKVYDIVWEEGEKQQTKKRRQQDVRSREEKAREVKRLKAK